MPHGDPAGYLPSVLKARKRKGQKAYQPGRKRRGQVPASPKVSFLPVKSSAKPKLDLKVPPPRGARPSRKRRYSGRAN
jgi:hypothetical protein